MRSLSSGATSVAFHGSHLCAPTDACCMDPMIVLTQAPTSRSVLARVFSFHCLLGAVLVTCVYLMVPVQMQDPDIWWHLRNAQYQLQTHSFIRSDMYSFTAHGAPWMNHEWLAELPFYAGWQLFGLRGLFFVTAAAIECIFLAVFYRAYRHSGDIKAALPVSLVAAFLSTVSFGPRTLLFGWIALSAELILLDGIAEGRPQFTRRARWMLPALFVIWVNTHGSWLIGMVVLLAFVTCGSIRFNAGSIENLPWSHAQRNSLTLTTGLCVAALFVNPYGWRLVAYPFDLAFHQRLNIANVEEWASLDFHSPRGHVLLLSLTLIFFCQLFRSRRWTLYEMALLAIGVYAAFTYSRFLFLAAILIFPMMARDLRGLAAYSAEKDKPWLNAALVCGLLFFVVRHMPPAVGKAQGGARAFPDHALPFLQSFHPQGNVFNDYLWGGFLEWHTRQIPVLIDSRVDIFEYGGVFKDYLDATELKNTLAILDKYKIRYVLFERETPLVYLMQHTPGWKTDYQDASTVLIERVAAHTTGGS